jgi:hypothetical protein
MKAQNYLEEGKIEKAQEFLAKARKHVIIRRKFLLSSVN